MPYVFNHQKHKQIISQEFFGSLAFDIFNVYSYFRQSNQLKNSQGSRNALFRSLISASSKISKIIEGIGGSRVQPLQLTPQ